MLKSFNNSDIQVTPFVAEKQWEIKNTVNEDLVLWISGSLSGSITHTYIDYEDGTSTPITNSYCSIALQQQSAQLPLLYQQGLNNLSSSFYAVNSPRYYSSEENPVNLTDKSYKRLVYNTHKNLFYNTGENFTTLLGLENINLSSSVRLLTDTMEVFTLTAMEYGEKIVPNSVKIIDSQLDQEYVIVDDGNTNLILSGSYFGKFQELSV